MDKDRIMIVNKNLSSGGIVTSLLNFIDNMEQKVEIESFFCCYEDENVNKIKNIKVYKGNKLLKFFSSVRSIGTKKSKSKKSIIRKVFKFIYNHLGIRRFFKFLSLLITKKISTKYDLVLCYSGQDEICANIALKKFNSKKKWIYIHEDVSKYGLNKYVLKTLKHYDKILCVSRSSAEIFKNKYIHLADKVDYLYNFQNNEKIIELSKEFEVSYNKDALNIVSASRIVDSVKGYKRSINVFKKLREEGYKFNWHILGSGIDYLTIQNYIKENNMTDSIFMYGNQENPYPYIRDADLFYLGSYYESWGLVLIESMILNVPILTTQTSSSKELLDGKGFLCKNNEEAIYNEFKTIFNDLTLLKEEKKKLNNYKYENQKIVNKFYDLLNDL